MKKIIAFLLISTLILSCSCTKKDDEDAYLPSDESTQVQDDETTNIESNESSKADENKQNESSSDDKQNESEDIEKEPEQENKNEVESSPPNNSEVVTPNENSTQVDVSSPIATPKTSFEYFVDKVNKVVTINRFLGDEINVVVPETIDGYPVTYVDGFTDSNIESVVFSKNVATIGENSFENCKYLKTIEFKSSSFEILSYAFYGCSSIEELILPEGLNRIGAYAFADCTSLKRLHIPASLKSYGHRMFSGVSIEYLTFAEGVETIGDPSDSITLAFKSSKTATIKSVIFPASLKTLHYTIGFSYVDEIIFEGDLPSCERLRSMLTTNTVIKYKKGTKGWDDRILRGYKLVEID